MAFIEKKVNWQRKVRNDLIYSIVIEKNGSLDVSSGDELYELRDWGLCN